MTGMGAHYRRSPKRARTSSMWIYPLFKALRLATLRCQREVRITIPAHRRRAARLRQTLGGRSGGPLVCLNVALMAMNRDACGVPVLARQAHVDGTIIVEIHALLLRFSCAFAAHRATWNVRRIGANPAATLQVGGCGYAPSAARFLVVFMQEIGAFGAKSKIGVWAQRGGFSEGKIKEHGTTPPRFWKLSLSARCLGGARAAPHFLPPWCRDFAQSLGFAGFRPAPWPPNVRFWAASVGTRP